MPFDLDNRDADFRRDIFFHRPATTIAVRSFDGEELLRLDLEEKNLTRAECDPEWVRMHEAELAEVQT